MTHLKKFAVTYTIDYTHRVIVGVTAPTAKTAEKIASDAFDEGSIWDNTPEMPLLFDDYEEDDGETLCFSSEEVPEFPEPDSSVKDLKQKKFAYYACQALLAGEVDTARDFARKALPHVVEPIQHENTWVVKSDNGCDPFEVVAAGREDALRDALYAIGWTVSTKQDTPSGTQSDLEFQCDQCGRVYDDTKECLSDDCLAKDHDL